MWPHQFNSNHGVEPIAYIFRVSPKAQLFRVAKNQNVITWSTRDFFRSHWAFFLNQPSLVVGWPFYNSKSSKPNGLASPFRRRNKRLLATFRSFYSTKTMARPPACPSSCWHPPPAGKDKPACFAVIKGNDTYTPALAVSRALSPTPAFALAPLLASAPINANAMVRYSEADL